MTSIPASVQSATVPAALKSMSSGWAATTRTRWISESLSMIPILGGGAQELEPGGGPRERIRRAAGPGRRPC